MIGLLLLDILFKFNLLIRLKFFVYIKIYFNIMVIFDKKFGCFFFFYFKYVIKFSFLKILLYKSLS